MGDTINYPRRSNSATTANFAIIVLVGYLVLTYLKPILMPFCIAILIYFLIRAPEQYLVARFEIVERMPILAYGVMIGIGAAISYGISILLYNNIDQFQEEMPVEVVRLYPIRLRRFLPMLSPRPRVAQVRLSYSDFYSGPSIYPDG